MGYSSVPLGEPYWTVLTSWTREYDEETGPHTGSKDFLLELE